MDFMKEMTPYRDPRTAFGRGASTPRIPVGQAIEHFGPLPPEFGGPAATAAPAAAPVAPAAAPAAQAARPTAAAVADIGAPAARGAAYRIANTAGRMARVAGPAAVGANVVSGFNDFKINDPSVDSSAAGTFNALRAGDIGGAGRSLSKGALETMMDLGGSVANIADAFVPGKAPVSTAYRTMLRNQFGDQLVDNSGGQPVAAPAAPAAAPAQPYSDARQGPAVPAQPGDITFNRGTKEYSGTDVKAGAPIIGGRGGGSTTALPTPGFDGYKQQLANIRSIGDMPSQSMGDGGITVGQGAGDLGGARKPAPAVDAQSLSRGGRAGRAAAALAMQQADRQEQRDIALRGQDIGAATAAAGAANQRDIAAMQGQTQRDVANIGSEARIEAASQRANPTVVVGGGMVPVDDGMGGTKYVMAPQRLVNRITGEDVGGKPAAPAPSYVKGQVYTDARGNKATWDGTKFVAAK